jgi:hypothetical protein
MREPTIYGRNEAKAIALCMAKLEAIFQGNAVAVILQSPTGEMMVAFNPGDELASLDACRTIDWDSTRPVVAEFSGC